LGVAVTPHVVNIVSETLIDRSASKKRALYFVGTRVVLVGILELLVVRVVVFEKEWPPFHVVNIVSGELTLRLRSALC